jgi:MFS family permease
MERTAVLPTRKQQVAILMGAAILLSLSMGMRQSFGLFVLPVTRDLGFSVADFTFAMALQNLIWGIAQPFAGAWADRFGTRPVLMVGCVLYILGIGTMALARGWTSFTIGAGLFIGISLACSASSLGLSAAARAVSLRARSMALGMVSAVGSVGTFFCAPLAQTLIAGDGWQDAFLAFTVLALGMLPAAFATGVVDKVHAPAARAADAMPMRAVLREAARHRGFVIMSAAYFVCGMQLMFITAHLPTYLSLCGQDPMLGAKALATIGLFNIVGCYLFGWLGGRFPKHILLGLLYILRSITITIYFMAPVSPASTLVFAAIMGVLWLGVVPVSQGLVAEMFGLRYLATLSGIAFVNHQIGSFVGVWGGGLVLDYFGSYDLAFRFGVSIGLIAGVAQILAGAGSDWRSPRPVPA